MCYRWYMLGVPLTAEKAENRMSPDGAKALLGSDRPVVPNFIKDTTKE